MRQGGISSKISCRSPEHARCKQLGQQARRYCVRKGDVSAQRQKCMLGEQSAAQQHHAAQGNGATIDGLAAAATMYLEDGWIAHIKSLSDNLPAT